MGRIKPRTLSGFMELAPREQVLFDTITQKLRGSFSLFGFTPLDTPLIEASDVLLAKGGGETEKQIYRFMKGDSDLSLRFDLTVPLAKYTALNYSKLAFPFRRYQIGKVYRGERAQRGRFREFYQADIDIIGDGSLSLLNEAEIPAVIYKCLKTLGLTRFIIRINNRKILNGFFEIIGVTGAKVMQVIDKLDKIGADRVREILCCDAGVNEDQARQIIEFLTPKDDPLEFLKDYLHKNETFDAGLYELSETARHIKNFGVPEASFKIDLTIARGLDYYTGTVYETTMIGHPEIGSICSGGRYDDLAGYYTDKKLPGVGISIGLTRLFYILQEQNYLNMDILTAPTDVLIIPMTTDISHAVKLAAEMRENGLRVQIHGEDKKFKAKISYADKLGIPFTVFLGEDELKNNHITVKDMKTGEQTSASAAILTRGIKEKIEAMRGGAPVDC